MCLGGPPEDKSAEIARQREQERKERIEKGQNRIDATFTSAFTPQYYDTYQGDYLGYYEPQLDDKYADAKRKAILGLAGAGNLASSAAGRRLGDIRERYMDTKSQLEDRALSAASDLRGRVDSAKTDLYGLNSSAADPSLAAERAAARVGALQSPPSYSPLGNVFADLLNTAAFGVQAEKQGYKGLGTGLFNQKGSSKGSQMIVT